MEWLNLVGYVKGMIKRNCCGSLFRLKPWEGDRRWDQSDLAGVEAVGGGGGGGTQSDKGC